jgi:hypothetical protein
MKWNDEKEEKFEKGKFKTNLIFIFKSFWKSRKVVANKIYVLILEYKMRFSSCFFEDFDHLV